MIDLKKVSFLSILVLLTCSIISCDDASPVDEGKDVVATAVQKRVPDFNADSSFQYVKAQVEFGPRVPNSDAHKKCREYFINYFESLGLKVYRQNFEAIAYDGTVLHSTNIIAEINPEAKKRVMLAAHWDTRPFADRDTVDVNKPIDGANDGASGVGVLMEIARSIQAAKDKPNVGVDIVLFDAEDYGEPAFYTGETKAESWCLGSQYWSNNKHIPNYHAFYGILLDMVGSKDVTFYQEEGSLYYAKSIVDKVWSKGNSLGYSNYFINEKCDGIIDDHIFVNRIAQIPMIDIIHYNHQNHKQFFGNYWHTHDDNISVIDKKSLKVVGHTVLAVLYDE